MLESLFYRLNFKKEHMHKKRVRCNDVMKTNADKNSLYNELGAESVII